jgi:hypothetical protein
LELEALAEQVELVEQIQFLDHLLLMLVAAAVEMETVVEVLGEQAVVVLELELLETLLLEL